MEYLVEFEDSRLGEGPSWHSSTALQSDSAKRAINAFEAKKQKQKKNSYKSVYAAMGYEGYGARDQESGRKLRNGTVHKK